MRSITMAAISSLMISASFANPTPGTTFPRSFLLRYSCPTVDHIEIDGKTLIATGEGELDGCDGTFSASDCTNPKQWLYAPPAPKFTGTAMSKILPKQLASVSVSQDASIATTHFLNCHYDNGLVIRYPLETYDPIYGTLFSDNTLHYIAQIG